jgi:hypothetical protein
MGVWGAEQLPCGEVVSLSEVLFKDCFVLMVHTENRDGLTVLLDCWRREELGVEFKSGCGRGSGTSTKFTLCW